MSRKPYVRPMPKTWWLEKPFYIKYMVREASSFFMGVYSAVLVIGLWRLSGGPDDWATFVSALTSPVAIVFQLIGLAFSVYHTITFLDVTPRTMPIMIGDDFVANEKKLAILYVAWGFVSVVVFTAVLL